MKYRQFGQWDWKVSALGFGAMRLPILDGDNAKIDEELAKAMIRKAINGGVNYIDTAYPYHRGQSEGFIAKVLKDGYREKVRVATKMPSWLVKTTDDFDRLLDEQLERLEIEQLDYYLLHALNAKYWNKYQDLHIFDWAEKKISEGKFKYLGFSFHDEYPVFHEILKGYDNWSFCQIQYNFMDINYQAGQKGLKEAAEKGLAVVVMEPLRGGSLAKTPVPGAIARVWAQSTHAWRPVEWALQWVWNQPEVSVVLSGMSTMEQVEENLISAGRSQIGSLNVEDEELIDKVRSAYHSLVPIPCTQCEYCLPCPSDVAIPRIFSLYNDAIMYDSTGGPRWAYANQIKAENRADNCTECGECEIACPQNIEIINWLKIAGEYLSAGEGA